MRSFSIVCYFNLWVLMFKLLLYSIKIAINILELPSLDKFFFHNCIFSLNKQFFIMSQLVIYSKCKRLPRIFIKIKWLNYSLSLYPSICVLISFELSSLIRCFTWHKWWSIFLLNWIKSIQWNIDNITVAVFVFLFQTIEQLKLFVGLS